MSLVFFKEGSIVSVESIVCPRNLKERLNAIGIWEGKKLSLLAKNNGLFLIEVDDMKIMLGKRQARAIYGKEVANETFDA